MTRLKSLIVKCTHAVWFDLVEGAPRNDSAPSFPSALFNNTFPFLTTSCSFPVQHQRHDAKAALAYRPIIENLVDLEDGGTVALIVNG